MVRESAGRASRFSGKGEGGEVKRAGGTHGCGGAAVEPGSPRCPRHRCDPRRAQFRGGETCRGGDPVLRRGPDAWHGVGGGVGARLVLRS